MNLMIYLSYINCSIVLLSLISAYFIPDNKLYDKNHFIDILKIKYVNFSMNNDDNINITSEINTIRNYTNIITNVVEQLNTSKIFNFLINVFSSFHLSFSFWSFLKDFANLGKNANILYNSCLVLLSVLILVIALIILININKITKEYDYENIGLTSDIKIRVIIIIIMMSINIVIIIVNYFLLSKIKTCIKPKRDKIQDENKKLKESLQKKQINEIKRKEEDEGINALNEAVIKKKEELLKEKNKLKDDIDKINRELFDIKRKQIFYDINENENEELIAMIFVCPDQGINNFPMIGKYNEKFVDIEQRLYDIFPKYKESNNAFIVNGSPINRNYTIKECKIKDGDIINLIIPD